MPLQQSEAERYENGHTSNRFRVNATNAGEGESRETALATTSEGRHPFLHSADSDSH